MLTERARSSVLRGSCCADTTTATSALPRTDARPPAQLGQSDPRSGGGAAADLGRAATRSACEEDLVIIPCTKSSVFCLDSDTIRQAHFHGCPDLDLNFEGTAGYDLFRTAWRALLCRLARPSLSQRREAACGDVLCSSLPSPYTHYKLHLTQT